MPLLPQYTVTAHEVVADWDKLTSLPGGKQENYSFACRVAKILTNAQNQKVGKESSIRLAQQLTQGRYRDLPLCPK